MRLLDWFRRHSETHHHENMALRYERVLARNADYPSLFEERLRVLTPQIEYHRERARKLREEATKS